VQQETRGGVSELVAASFKYEASSLKAPSRTDYLIHRNTDEIIGEIVKQFTLVARNGGGEARITLQPEFLGDLKLDLKLKGKEISTFILVESQAVKDLIVTRLNVLEQGLLQHGFSLGSFQVEVKDGGQGMKSAVQGGRKARAGSTGSEHGQEPPGVEPLARGVPWLSTVVNITV
jgi:flagellar hook-length control protein FliK